MVLEVVKMLAAGLAIVAETKAAADFAKVGRSRLEMAVFVEFPHLPCGDGKSDTAQERPAMKAESKGDFGQLGVDGVACHFWRGWRLGVNGGEIANGAFGHSRNKAVLAALKLSREKFVTANALAFHVIKVPLGGDCMAEI
jgi:hypothetical protein